MKPAAVLLALALPAQAAIIGVVPLDQGVTLRLHDDAGPCVGQALRAEYVTPGKPTVPGCYVVRRGMVNVVFFDADIGEFPAALVKKPEEI